MLRPLPWILASPAPNPGKIFEFHTIKGRGASLSSQPAQNGIGGKRAPDSPNLLYLRASGRYFFAPAGCDSAWLYSAMNC
jgi:hypothetical protein